MSSKYSGVVGDWLENNKTFVTDKFPTLPAPFHMADQREALTASGKTSLVRTCFPPPPLPLGYTSRVFSKRRAVTDSNLFRPATVTCLDPRSVPEAFFGPDFRGAVIRNAGGRATDDAVRSLTVLKALAGVKTVAVVHHTGRNMTFFLSMPRVLFSNLGLTAGM